MDNRVPTWPGKPFPLGATWDGNGVNFALFSANASGVELCLFDQKNGGGETARIPFTECTDQIWHAYIPGLKPGQLYAYRVYGDHQPEQGKRFNPAKLLLDPYTRAIAGDVQWDDALYGYPIGDPQEDLAKDERDSAPFLPKCVVIDPSFDWGGDRPLDIPLIDSIIYETHVRGMTMLHPEVPDNLRGTYAGLASEPVIQYLKDLGVTAVELMPIHEFVNDRYLEEKQLNNYWGYNSIAFFAPEAKYSSAGVLGQQVNEFKQMVKTLHAAGIEVILDVVYNHTAEGNEKGPTLSFRGIDNIGYYRLVADNQRFYMDYTGTGNTLNMTQPNALKLLMDSLRYWIEEMHVDGFRFDLASALARELHDVDRLSSFFDIIHQDPVISRTKLIAEPWDIGEGGYQVGSFPPLWAEWNGKYRDSMRDFWRGEHSTLAEFANRFTGSSDLYQSSSRSPVASINLITAHDGFTLRDLVSYNEKHNGANGENNNDGHSDNRSYNYGAEGPTDDPGIRDVRSRQVRNFLATLLLSQGVPMLLHGDELGRTQQGNNNAYAQDNEISWIHWDEIDSGLLEFTRQAIALRRSHPVFRQRKWFQGAPVRGGEALDIAWFSPNGSEMSESDWNESFAKSLMIFLNGGAIRHTDERGQPIVDRSFLLLFNAHSDPVDFTLPANNWGIRWERVLFTGSEDLPDKYQSKDQLSLPGRSLMVLCHAN